MLLARKRHVLAATQSVASPTYQSKVIADGASNYWRLNETSGTTAIDSVGGANGTISGEVLLGVPGPISKAARFNISTVPRLGHVVINSIVQPVNMSVEFWFNTNYPSENMLNSFASAVTYMGDAGAGIVLRFADSGSFNGTRVINDGNWHHVVITLSSTTVTGYIDGTLETSAANARPSPNTGTFEIGSHANPHWMIGDLAEVAIYPLVLSPAQIASHYAAR